MQATGSLTSRLHRYFMGQRELGDSILREAFPRLCKIAANALSNEYAPPVSPTELVNEAWLAGLHNAKWTVENREHFYSIVGLVMANVLKSMARKRKTVLRGGGAPHLPVHEAEFALRDTAPSPDEVVTVCLLLEKLAETDPGVADVVRLHHLVGFTLEEIAEGTGLTLRQIRYRWQRGKTWVASQLAPYRSTAAGPVQVAKKRPGKGPNIFRPARGIEGQG